ncbi:MAG: hypothetical protein MUP82_10420 [Candidatus Marinimicrobia bacterium]|nr:hypothetical protein [Candidatus Neomarinimicrobiota bacterium]
MKVDSEVAEKDFQRFVEALNLSSVKLERLEKDEKTEVLRLIEHGALAIKDDGIAVLYPFDEVKFGDEIITEIEFCSRRITVKELEKHSQGKTDIEKTRRMFAFLIGKPSAFLERLSSDDFINFSQVAAFFLPR